MVNVANTPPPGFITVNGTDYEVLTDFRVWADIMIYAQEELYDQPEDDEQIIHNWKVLIELQKLAFLRVLDEPHTDVFAAIMEFMKGYPCVDNGHERDIAEDGAKTFSLSHDMNYIVLAIRNQSGIDLTYKRTEPFHWWLFLLEFQTLTDDHLICHLMHLRAYSGDDKDTIRRRDRVALPVESTRSEQAMLDKMEELFPNT